MLLVDSSAWIAHLRGTHTPTAMGMMELIETGTELAITEPIAMELLAGADSDVRAQAIEGLVNGLILVAVDPQVDFHQAAAIFRAVRRTGRTPRSMVDCLIAAVASRRDVELVHNDADFDAIASCWPLRVSPLR
ncbi:MAG: PIN domain nuclease [Geodermatophilaceae bacterium]|nr:PIN domain nuclease [Geodermatophilaceae bacterium]